MGLWGDIAYGLMAVLIGVVVSYAVFFFLDKAVNLLPKKAQEKLRYLAFILPAAALVIVVLLYPLIDTIVLSFFNEYSNKFVGFKNYAELFTSETFFGILLNNFLWLAFVPAVTVGIGLLFANLTNRMGPGRERIFKSLVFMPMSISFISAGTIWKLFYVSVPPGRPEIGLFNSIITSLGGQPQNLLANDTWHLNSFLLMIIVIWLQAGFSMVMLSAAIKGVPEETIEAARIDGASVRTIFFKVVVPQIRGTIMSVFITVLILVMKIFDIVLAMTGGNFNTSVLGFDYYRELFVNSNFGSASAVVTILCVLIAPLMWLQIRSVRNVEENR